MGLPRPLRLARPEAFARVRAQGRTFRSRHFLLSLAPNGLPLNRFGLVTGKKLGGAVVRNRVRRLLREVLRLSQDRLRSGWDVVLVAHPAAVGLSVTEIQRTFDALASQAGLLRE